MSSLALNSYVPVLNVPSPPNPTIEEIEKSLRSLRVNTSISIQEILRQLSNRASEEERLKDITFKVNICETELSTANNEMQSHSDAVTVINERLKVIQTLGVQVPGLKVEESEKTTMKSYLTVSTFLNQSVAKAREIGEKLQKLRLDQKKLKILKITELANTREKVLEELFERGLKLNQIKDGCILVEKGEVDRIKEEFLTLKLISANIALISVQERKTIPSVQLNGTNIGELGEETLERMETGSRLEIAEIRKEIKNLASSSDRRSDEQQAIEASRRDGLQLQTHVLSDGSRFTGLLKNGSPDGNGALEYQTVEKGKIIHKKVVGNFNDGKPPRLGKLYVEGWSVYEGSLKVDSGDIIPLGEGALHYKNGKNELIFKGVFNGNKFKGHVSRTYFDDVDKDVKEFKRELTHYEGDCIIPLEDMIAEVRIYDAKLRQEVQRNLVVVYQGQGKLTMYQHTSDPSKYDPEHPRTLSVKEGKFHYGEFVEGSIFENGKTRYYKKPS